MANSEEIDNIETFPVSARKSPLSMSEEDLASKLGEKVMFKRQRHLTPVSSMKVEYRSHGEQPDQNIKLKSEAAVRQQNYAKRADLLGLLLLGSAIVVFAVIILALYFHNKRSSLRTSVPMETTAAVVDFYQGNHVFSQKVEAEKALKEGHLVRGLSTVNDDLEVSLIDQMRSMSAKMEKMRSQKQLDEPLPPPPDKGPKLDMLTRLKPTKTENFESPLEFNGALPKTLLNGK